MQAGNVAVTWLLLTGAGLIAEAVLIVVLGSTVTARYDTQPPPAGSSTAPDSGRDVRPGGLPGDGGAHTGRRGPVP